MDNITEKIYDFKPGDLILVKHSGFGYSKNYIMVLAAHSSERDYEFSCLYSDKVRKFVHDVDYIKDTVVIRGGKKYLFSPYNHLNQHYNIQNVQNA